MISFKNDAMSSNELNLIFSKPKHDNPNMITQPNSCNHSSLSNLGIALGGGGARGLAHILALETIDDLGIKPTAIAGTSMGAIIGALYASGRSGREIRENLEKSMLSKSADFKEKLRKTPDLFKWLSIVRLEMNRGGLLNTNNFLNTLMDEIGVSTFEELAIPLHLVTTDFWTGKEVVLSTGALRPAINASMAIPGVFAPVVIEDRVLVDGGLVNNVPYSVLSGRCDHTVAIDVAPCRVHHPDKPNVPDVLEAVIGMFDLMSETDRIHKKKQAADAIYIHPKICDVRVLDFDKMESVFEQSEEAMRDLKQQLLTKGADATSEKASVKESSLKVELPMD